MRIDIDGFRINYRYTSCVGNQNFPSRAMIPAGSRPPLHSMLRMFAIIDAVDRGDFAAGEIVQLLATGSIDTPVLSRYQERYPDFGPTLVADKLVLDGHMLDHETLPGWLLKAGLWQKRRKRGNHGSWLSEGRNGNFSETFGLKRRDYDSESYGFPVPMVDCCMAQQIFI